MPDPSVTSRLLAGFRRVDPRLAATGGAVVGGLLVLVIVLGLTGGGGRPPRLPGAGSDGVTLEALKRGTVLISAQASNPTSWGSGTIISSDGLILTNAHVAENRAPGLGVMLGKPIEGDLGPEVPDTLYVYTVDGDEPAVATWRAQVLAADGYLDLAVLRITADAGGRAVAAAELDLPAVPLGTSHDLPAGSELDVLGFPGIASSLRVHVTRGVLSNFSDDARAGPKGWINTDAKISPGNSGGLAAHGGRIVGVPDRAVTDPTGLPQLEYVLRPIELAFPLIEAARAGTAWDPYTYVVRHSGAEAAEILGWSDTDGADCDSTSATLPGGTTTVRAQLRLTNMVPGDHLWIALLRGTGAELSMIGAYTDEWPRDAGTDGCFQATFKAAAPLDDGDYSVGLLVGANYEHAMPMSGRLPVAIGPGRPTGETPVESPGASPTSRPDTNTCPETDPDRWAFTGGVIPTPEMPFPGDNRAAFLGFFTGQLTPPGGVATLDEADRAALAGMAGMDMLSDHWHVLLVDGRFHAYSGATVRLASYGSLDLPRAELLDRFPCVIDPDRYEQVAFHARSVDTAASRSYRYDSRVDRGASITDAVTGAIVWQPGLAPSTPTPGPGVPAEIPTVPGSAADTWLLTEVTGRSGTTGCQVFGLDSAAGPAVISLAACAQGRGYERVIYSLFSDAASLDAFLEGRRSDGYANAQATCGATTWAYADSLDVARGQLLCGSFTTDAGVRVAQIHWSEPAYRVVGVMEESRTAGDIGALWEAWKSSGVFESPR